MEARGWLEELERSVASAADALAPLAYLAGRAIAFGDEELNASRRRALLVLAAGGDPRRELEPDGRAARTLAADLDDRERRDELAAALAELRQQAHGLPRVERALAELESDRERAWLWLACALLAEELAGDD